MADVKVYKQDSGKDYEVTAVMGGERMPNKITDIQEVNFNLIDFSAISYEIHGQLIVTSEIPESFSNVINIYNITYEAESRRVYFLPIAQFQSVAAEKNTFKVTRLEFIPQSYLVIIVDEEKGFYFFDMISLKMMKFINIYQSV